MLFSSNPEFVKHSVIYIYSPVDDAAQPLRPPRRKKAKKRPNIFKGGDDSQPPGVPVIPERNAFHFPGTGKSIRLPAAGAGTEAMMDDHGFADLQGDYDFLEDGASESPVLRKVESTLPATVDPNFDVKYDDTKHGEYLRKNLATGHLPADIALRLINVIKKHWRVFDPNGLKYTIIGYECDIDTGNAKPISCGNVNYGPRESVVMRKHIKVCQ